MIVSSIKESSRLYNVIAQMGLLSTVTEQINNIRSNSLLYDKHPLNSDDINRISYNGEHFLIDTDDIQYAEIWVGNEYINPKTLSQVERDNNTSYCILPKKYNKAECKYFVNNNIVFRYSNLTNDISNKTYTILISDNDTKYDEINLLNSCFYISQNAVKKPIINYENGLFTITAPYCCDIDFFICSNMVYVGDAKTNTGFLINDPMDTKTYANYIIGNDDMYPVDCRFYPYLRIDKDSIVRVYSYNYTTIGNASSRLINYPEFIEVNDPYNSKYDFLENYIPSSMVIKASDTDETIIDKFKQISAEYYKSWKTFPKEQLDSRFIISDNNNKSDPTFIKRRLLDLSEVVNVHISCIPFNEYRDILFYDGELLSDYKIGEVKVVDDSYCEYSDGSMWRYIIPGSYDINKLTIVKFNSEMYSSIENIKNQINLDNFINLNHKVNRFYSNLLILKKHITTLSGSQIPIHIGVDEPTSEKDYYWFKVLSTANPGYFETKIVDKIASSGNAESSELLKAGMYWLDDGGLDDTNTYTQLLMTCVDQGLNNTDKLLISVDDNAANKMLNMYYDHKDDSQVKTFLKSEYVVDSTVELIMDKLSLISIDEDSSTTTDEVKNLLMTSEDTNIVASSSTLTKAFNDIDVTLLEGVNFPKNPNDNMLMMQYEGSTNPPPIIEDTELRTMYIKNKPNTMKHHDMWVKWLESVRHNITYSSKDTMLLKMNEHVIGIKFVDSDIDIITFDDIVLNYRNSCKGIKYNTILADLLSSGIITQNDIHIFDKRLITATDDVDIELAAVRTHTSYMVSKYKSLSENLSYVYSLNMKRVSMCYDLMSDIAKELSYKMIINYHDIDDFAFIKDKMLLFINGKLINRNGITEPFSNTIKVSNFNELIYTVDILYDLRDIDLIKIKRVMSDNWHTINERLLSLYYDGKSSSDLQLYITNNKVTSEEVDLIINNFNIISPDYVKPSEFINPDMYSKMIKISNHDRTLKGFYDVLYDDMIKNGKLQRLLKYYNDHPDEFSDFKKYLISCFSEISDHSLFGDMTTQNKIVIGLNNSGNVSYQI